MHASLEEGWLLLEDLGDTTLEAWTVAQADHDWTGKYQESVDILVRIHHLTHADLLATPVLNRAFDQMKLDFEYVFHFQQRFLHDYLKWVPTNHDREILDNL